MGRLMVSLMDRHEGCRAVFQDDGGDKQIVPVCMGGLAIVGCNNSESCGHLYAERSNKSEKVVAIRLNQEGRVCGLTTARRMPSDVIPGTYRDAATVTELQNDQESVPPTVGSPDLEHAKDE